MNTFKALQCTIGFALLGFFVTTSICSEEVRIQTLLPKITLERKDQKEITKNLAQMKAQARVKAMEKFVAQQKKQAVLDAQQKRQAWNDAIAKLETKKQTLSKVIAKRAEKKQVYALLVQKKARFIQKDQTMALTSQPQRRTANSYLVNNRVRFPSIK